MKKIFSIYRVEFPNKNDMSIFRYVDEDTMTARLNIYKACNSTMHNYDIVPMRNWRRNSFINKEDSHFYFKQYNQDGERSLYIVKVSDKPDTIRTVEYNYESEIIQLKYYSPKMPEAEKNEKINELTERFQRDLQEIERIMPDNN